ncbi:MAG: GAF domain-containing protein [Bernardetiaceae bacterium]|jgi:serine phosphatase RsbU (regulator of sigma subunit)|nr:GAF domain-containing protein [Bernardetiaceae bacterium]
MVFTANQVHHQTLLPLLARLAGELRLPHLVELIVAAAKDHAGAAYICLLEGGPGRWVILREFGESNPEIPEMGAANGLAAEHTRLDQGLVNQAFLRQQACAHNHLVANQSQLHHPQAISASAIPLAHEGKTLAVLYCEYLTELPTQAQELLVGLAPNLSVCLHNALQFAKATQQIDEKKAEALRHRDQASDARQNVKLLADIGKDIAAQIGIEDIIQTVYANINLVMDASVFDIGVLNEKLKRIEFFGTIEKGQRLPYHYYSLTNKHNLSVCCLENNREIVMNDLDAEYNLVIPDRPVPPPVAGERPDSLIFLPVHYKSKALGVVSVQGFSKNLYTKYHVDFLRGLAVYIGIALENAQLYKDLEGKVAERTAEVVKQKEELQASHEQLERSFNNIKILSDIGLEITTELSSEKIVDKTYANLSQLMDVDGFSVGILNDARTHLEFKGGRADGQPQEDYRQALNDPHSLAGWAFAQQREVAIGDWATEACQYLGQLPQAEKCQSVICQPMIGKNGPMGVISVQSFRRQAYDDFHVGILRNVALLAAMALENAETYRKIEEQHAEIRKINERTMASINYARRIQAAMLPDRAAIQAALPDSFLMFRPRDIVSGDFYWFLEKDGKIFVAAIDCTGHGVPGAFMSMIGNEFLNEIVNLMHIESPELILEQLHRNVRKALKQADSDNRDGMDIALCVVDRANQVLEFAGAKSPLIYLQTTEAGPEVFHLKGDKHPVGGLQKETVRTFTKHTIALDRPTSFYIFSDGLQDQFGGPEGRKFSTARLKDLFLQNHHYPMDRQRGILRNALNEWMGHEKQIDDMLIIGFRVG